MTRVLARTFASSLVLLAITAFMVSGSTSHAKPAPVPPQPAPETNSLFSAAAAFPVDENSDPEALRIEELRAQLAAQNLELLGMQRDAESARGEDAHALWSRSIELRLASALALGEWVDNVETLAANGEDVSKYREQLNRLLPGAALSAQSLFTTVTRSIADVSAKLEGASEDAGDLQSSLQHYDVQAGRILAVLADQVEDLDAFELPSEAARNWLSERLGARARLAAARIHLSSLKLADAETASELAPEDAALDAATAAMAARLGAHNESLAAVVAMLNTLEIDTTQYQRILIESTGEITTDMFGHGVLRDLASSWLASAKDSALVNGPNVIFKSLLFALVVALFWGASHLVRGVVERALVHSRLRLSTLLKRMMISLASGGVFFIGVLIAFSQLGVELGPLLAGLGIAGFVLGFALQDTLANFAAGIMILVYRPYDVEDLIECAGGVFGRVSAMNLVSTTILTLDNQTRVVPNGKIWGDVITNVTAQYSRRVDLVFGISYSDDIPQTEEVLKAILEEHPKVLNNPESVVKVHELGDSSVNFVVRPWVEMDDYWDVYWDVTREVKLRFDREGISIPFPQRDVHLPVPGQQLRPLTQPEAVFGDSAPEAHDPPESED